MITVIICSIDPSKSAAAAANVEVTIGVGHEIFVHDNRQANWGLAKVYNHYAARAAGDILCFMHEDVLFLTDDWGREMESFYASHPEAGVVGFFGSQVKTASPSPVGYFRKYDASNYRRHPHSGGFAETDVRRTGQDDWSPVVQVDGMCMIVCREVWAECPFDGERFDGFHLYDLDFSVDIAQRYTNYVCHTALIDHAQDGRHNDAWYRYNRIFHEKWADRLPMSVIPLTRRELRQVESYTAYKYYKNALDHRQTAYLGYARRCFNRWWSLGYWLRLLPHRLRLVNSKRR